MTKKLKITTVYIEAGKTHYVFNDGIITIYAQDAWRAQHGDILHDDYMALIEIDNGLTINLCLNWISFLSNEPTKANLRKINFYVLCLRLLLAEETTLCC